MNNKSLMCLIAGIFSVILLCSNTIPTNIFLALGGLCGVCLSNLYLGYYTGRDEK